MATGTLDVSVWNLSVPLALLAACGPVAGSGDEVAAESSSSTTEVEPTGGPQCVQDDDCEPGYECISGQCEYSCDYCCGLGEGASTEDFRCGYYYECYFDDDCGDGEVCFDHSCAPDPSICEVVPQFEGELELAFVEASPDPIGQLHYAQLVPGSGPSLLAAQGDRILRSDGATFAPLLDIDDPIIHFATADLDGDGTTDLVTAGLVGVGTWLGTGDGGFAAMPAAAVAHVADQLAIGDAQGDGVPDVYARSSAGIHLLTGGGGGTLAEPELVSSLVVEELRAFDADGDGSTDLAIFAAPSHGVLLGADLASLHTLSHETSGGIVDLHAADFSGDGRADLMSVDAAGYAQGWVAPVLTTPVFTHHVANDVQATAAGDVNDDGAADLVSTTTAGLMIRYGGADPGGGALPISCWTSTAAPELYAQHLALGDHDGDGDVDYAFSDNVRVVVLLAAQ